MQQSVIDAHQSARLLRAADEPSEELGFLLRQLELPKEARPRSPETLTAAGMDGNLELGQFLDARTDSQAVHRFARRGKKICEGLKH